MPKHADTQIQMIYQLIVNLRFNEFKVTKHSFILHKTQCLDHGKFNILWNVAQKKFKKYIYMINLHILMKGLILSRRPKAIQTLFFIIILNINLCRSKLNAHKSSLIIYSTSPTFIFFGKQNRNFTTLTWLLKNWSQFASV